MEFKKISINGLSYGEIDKENEHYMPDDIYNSLEKVSNVDFRD